MKRLWGVLVMGGVILSWSVIAGGTDTASPAYHAAVQVAKAVDVVFRSSRTVYATEVVSKLKNDGTGSDFDYATKKGFAPLPAQFARDLAYHLAIVQKKSDDQQFTIVMRSRWNLNPNHELQDEFEKAGWQFLAHQQEDALKAGKSLQELTWKPFTQVDMSNGKKVLRYFSADPAGALSCVKCHNEWEKRPDIQQRRKAQGIEVGKVFRVHELMAALSITVPLNE